VVVPCDSALPHGCTPKRSAVVNVRHHLSPLDHNHGRTQPPRAWIGCSHSIGIDRGSSGRRTNHDVKQPDRVTAGETVARTWHSMSAPGTRRHGILKHHSLTSRRAFLSLRCFT
jgi:hypothetical protein